MNKRERIERLERDVQFLEAQHSKIANDFYEYDQKKLYNFYDIEDIRDCKISKLEKLEKNIEKLSNEFKNIKELLFNYLDVEIQTITTDNLEKTTTVTKLVKKYKK